MKNASNNVVTLFKCTVQLGLPYIHCSGIVLGIMGWILVWLLPGIGF